MQKNRRISSCRKCFNSTCNGPRTDTTGGTVSGPRLGLISHPYHTCCTVTCKMVTPGVACASYLLDMSRSDKDTGCSESHTSEEGIANEAAGVPSRRKHA